MILVWETLTFVQNHKDKRLVGLMNLILIVSYQINIEGREHH